MNKTRKSVLLTAAMTLLLIMGTAITPMQSYASGEHKKNGDIKSSIKSDADINKKSASQKMDQDNFCYRSDGCQQANQGQQIVGKDNEAAGFNDQSKNVQQQSVSPTPTPKTCEECIRSVLSPQQITALNEFFGGDAISIICNSASISESDFVFDLSQAGIDLNTANALVECLKAVGVAFVP